MMPPHLTTTNGEMFTSSSARLGSQSRYSKIAQKYANMSENTTRQTLTLYVHINIKNT